MNLIFRILFVYITSLFKPRLPVGKASNTLTLHVLPNDLDINLHMNDGRYITICDLNRVNLFIRTGLLKVMLKERWMPVIAEHTMTYKKSLGLFDRYTASMEITRWDDKGFHMTHTFTIGGRIAAEGTSIGMIRSQQGVIAPAQVIETVNRYRGNVQ